MFKVALVLVCLTCASNGRRVQAASEQRRDNPGDRKVVARQFGVLRLFSWFLCTHNPAQAWQTNIQLKVAGRGFQSNMKSAVINNQDVKCKHFLPLVIRSRYVCMDAANDASSKGTPSDGGSTAEQPVRVADGKLVQAERLALEAKKITREVEKLELQAAELRAKAPDNPSRQKVDPADNTTTRLTKGIDLSSLQTTPLLSAASNAKQQQLPETLATNRIARLMLAGKQMENLQLSNRQIEVARERVFFDLDTFYISKVDQTSIGTVFTGNLRTNSSIVFERVTSRAAAIPELQNIHFLLLGDPLDIPTVERGDLDPQPVFLALPADATRISQTNGDFAITLLSIVLTLFTTFGFSLSMYILADNGAFLKSLKDMGTSALFNIVPLDAVLSLTAGLVAVQLLHEFAHFVTAKLHSIEIGTPIFLPSYPAPFTGTITKILSFPSNRTALFDFAVAGPVAAGALSLVLYIIGLSLSVELPIPNGESISEAAAYLSAPKATSSFAASNAASSVTASSVASAPLMPVLPGGFLQLSLLLGFMAQLALPAVASGSLVSLHPCALVGFCGVLVNALQLLPIGQLDGGRAATALFGRYKASRLSAGMIYALIFSFILGNKNVCLGLFGAIAILFQRAPELPSADDVTAVDSRRETFATVALAMVVLTLLPCPTLPWLIPSTASTTPF